MRQLGITDELDELMSMEQASDLIDIYAARLDAAPPSETEELARRRAEKEAAHSAQAAAMEDFDPWEQQQGEDAEWERSVEHLMRQGHTLEQVDKIVGPAPSVQRFIAGWRPI